MYSARSMKTGALVDAATADYDSARVLLLVCPECKEPVHLQRRTVPEKVSYFAHPALRDTDTEDLCSLRVLGSWNDPVSEGSPWGSQGQLLRKFQLEVVSYFLNQLDSERGHLTKVLGGEKSHSTPFIHTTYLNDLTGLPSYSVYSKLREIADLPNEVGREIANAYFVIANFLSKRQARMVVTGLFHCSALVATSMLKIHCPPKSIYLGAEINGQDADFLLDKKKVQAYPERQHFEPGVTSVSYFRLLATTQYLLLRTLITWQRPGALFHKRFVHVVPPIHSYSQAVKTTRMQQGLSNSFMRPRQINPIANSALTVKAKHHPHLLTQDERAELERLGVSYR